MTRVCFSPGFCLRGELGSVPCPREGRGSHSPWGPPSSALSSPMATRSLLHCRLMLALPYIECFCWKP